MYVGWYKYRKDVRYSQVPEAKQVPLQRFLWLLLHLYCGDSVGELWWLSGVVVGQMSPKPY